MFHSGDQKPNIYDKFCQDIDGTTNSKRVVDAHGRPRDVAPAPSRRAKLKRTPPPAPDKYGSFAFELSWAKDDANRGCGQTVESCRAAFAKLADSPCGHQAGEQNALTAAGKITLKECGSYAYRITGPDVPKPAGPTPTPTPAPAPAPPPPDKPPAPPAPAPPPPGPDMSSQACKDCVNTIREHVFLADGPQYLADLCKADKSCQECKMDCSRKTLK